MRICRFNRDRLGLVSADGEYLIDVSEALEQLPSLNWPLVHGDPLFAHLAELVPAIISVAEGKPRIPINSVRLESPVATPSKIIAAPVNYQKHLDEANADAGINFGVEQKTIADYGLFLKAASALVGPADGVVLPPLDRRIDHELELAVIIGKPGRHIEQANAFDHVAGYAIGLDMTIRGLEDRSWRKSFESFAVLGPWIATKDEIADPGALDMLLTLDGEVRQRANTRDLVWNIPKLIEYASATYTLYPGDIILTGTPEGVAPVSPGDIMVCSIGGIGAMKVAVRVA
jgi:2,4-didehydro-3-deoxy-L-rhamnonate hydrolase